MIDVTGEKSSISEHHLLNLNKKKNGFQKKITRDLRTCERMFNIYVIECEGNKRKLGADKSS